MFVLSIATLHYIKLAELNWVKRRTSQEPYWLNWVRLSCSREFGPGLNVELVMVTDHPDLMSFTLVGRWNVSKFTRLVDIYLEVNPP